VSRRPFRERLHALRPGFGFDPGWLFIVAGLAILASGILLPVWRENQMLDRRLEQSRLAESQVQDRLTQSTMMLDQLRGNQDVIRRIARADLNRLNPGDEPVMRDLASPTGVLQWLDASAVQAESAKNPLDDADMTQSRLELMATGPRRLWFLGAGVMCLCIGLVLSPSQSKRPAHGGSAVVS